MAIIYSYPLNKNIRLLDELVGTTEITVNGQLKTVTRNFLIEDLSSFFISKGGIQKTITLTTNGTSGAATLNQLTGVLNIPQYSGGGGGSQDLQQVTDIGASTTNAINISGITNDYGLTIETSSNNYPSIYVDNAGSGVNANGLEVNSLEGAGAKIQSQNGVGIRAESVSGIPIVVFGNGNNTASIDVNLGNTNKGLVIDSGTSSTGNFIDLNKNGVNKLTVNQAGELTAAKLIKQGGTSTQFLMGDGSVTIGNGGVYSYEIHVSQVDGNDTTGTGAVLNPVASITKALTLITGQRRTIVIHPGNYTENPSITTQYTVLTTYEVVGGNTLLTGTLSTSTGCSITGLKMTNLTITAPTGTGNVNILNCDITGTLTKSSSADYTLIRFCDIGTTNITSTAGTVAFFGGNPNFITVNNAGARVIMKNCITIAPVLTLGSLTLADSIIISTTSTSNAITTSASTFLTLANSQIIIPAFNNVARVSLSGFYSILNCVFDKPNSTLVALSGTGGTTNSIVYSQFINADKFIKQGGTSAQILAADGSVITAGSNITISGGVISSTGGGGNTDLGYTPSPTNGIVTSSTGTDATLPLADATNAGFLKPAKFTVLENTSGTNTGDQSINTLTNVVITTLENNQLLVYESSTDLWKNKDVIINDSDFATTLNSYSADYINQSLNGILELGAFTFRANNTAGTTQAQNLPFKNLTNQTYTGTIVWTGGTAPSGSTQHTYSISQIGNLVTLTINLSYGTAGAAGLTSVTCELPSTAPTPALPISVSAVGDILNYGSGIITSTKQIPTTTASFCALRIKSLGTPNVYEVAVSRASAAYRYAYITIQYFV
jgi:hypothetical protein